MQTCQDKYKHISWCFSSVSKGLPDGVSPQVMLVFTGIPHCHLLPNDNKAFSM